jgi:Septum formation
VSSILVRIVIVGLIAGGAFLFRDRLPGHVQDLQVGDCFDLPSGLAEPTEIGDVSHHPCSEPHVFQAYAELRYPAGDDEPFPGELAIARWADQGCEEQFSAFVGMPLRLSTLGMYYFTPGEDGWELDDDRIVNCVVATEPLSTVTASLQGSLR